MTNKQILFWRIILFLIIISGGYLLSKTILKETSITQLFYKNKIENPEKIKLNIRKNNFYEKMDKTLEGGL